MACGLDFETFQPFGTKKRSDLTGGPTLKYIEIWGYLLWTSISLLSRWVLMLLWFGLFSLLFSPFAQHGSSSLCQGHSWPKGFPKKRISYSMTHHGVASRTGWRKPECCVSMDEGPIKVEECLPVGNYGFKYFEFERVIFLNSPITKKPMPPGCKTIRTSCAEREDSEQVALVGRSKIATPQLKGTKSALVDRLVECNFDKCQCFLSPKLCGSFYKATQKPWYHHIGTGHKSIGNISIWINVWSHWSAATGDPPAPTVRSPEWKGTWGHVEDRIQDQPGQLENGNQKLEIRWNK